MEKNTNKRPVTFTGRLFVCQAMLGLIGYVAKESMYLHTGKNIKIDWICSRQTSGCEQGLGWLFGGVGLCFQTHALSL